MSTQNKTSIEIELKKLNSNFNTFNKIMSSFLVIATSESTFKNKNNNKLSKLQIANANGPKKLKLESNANREWPQKVTS